VSPHLLVVSRAARIGIDPKEAAAAAATDSRLSDSVGLMFGFKADLTLPNLILLRSCPCYSEGTISVKWLMDVNCIM
jgi:hypothetical protein